MGGLADADEASMMGPLRRAARHIIDSWLPGVGRAYRSMRDERAALAPPVPTPFGFKLAGNVSMAAGAFETDETEIFLKHLQRASTCIDIGANIGLYTCLAAARGKHVIAVEPLAVNLAALYRNLLCNDFHDVEVFPLGLSGKAGIKRLFGGNTGASFLPGWAGASDRRHELVPVSTLDVIVNSRFNGQPILIKIDVEGFEYEVLNGAEHTLALSPRPAWLVEICLRENFPGGLNDKFHNTFEMFWRRGYEARTANREERPIHPSDVNRWVKQGYADFGSYNYLFL
ncbi:MAG: FkbM family methyltransferase [Rhizobiales bacterium]|nr:FkbM family methyltransferase [Hyphomicrobiales bacterium]